MSERTLTFGRAINQGLAQLLEADDRVFVIGEDIGRHGGSFQTTVGLQERFGESHVINAPISEAGIVGLALGASMTGLLPVVDLMFSDFMLLAMDQIVNQAAHIHYMTGGQATAPLVIRVAHGAGRSSGAQHSQSLHTWYAHVPGLKVLMPTTPHDAKGLLIAAVRDPNPVLIFEDKIEYGRRGHVPEEMYSVPIGESAVRRRGTDATIIATSSMVWPTLEAAEELANDSIDAEVIDVRSIAPLDRDTLVESASRTGRVVVVDEGHRSFGVGAEIAATIASSTFDYLEYPVQRIGAADVPVPFAPNLEKATIPNASDIVDAVRAMS